MIDALKEEQIVNKVGGRFKLSTLIQKRLAAINAGLYALAVIGVLTSVVGAYYYLLIVKTMYFDEPHKSFEPMPGEQAFVLGIAGLFNLLFFVYPAPLINAATTAARSLF